MSKNLIIVESPAKVKTIKKFLGAKYMVHASVGHIRDLPSKELGVDEETFIPKYVTIKGKEKIVNDLQEAAAKADTVFLAPDPDREGEAIAWHIAEIVKDYAKDIQRIQFNEITERAVKEALENPRAINSDLFEAQQARRILDRLVGYKISPLLWKSVKRGISAGRVQSVALRVVVEREEERRSFIPEEFWNFRAMLDSPPFKAELAKINGKKAVIENEEQALAIDNALKSQDFIVENVEEKERSRAPQAPFITSTLQQAASQRLGFSAKRTMTTAQRLYEGIDIEGKGTLALITYMRTDSVRIADEAKETAVDLIQSKYGKEYLAPGGKGRDYKSKKNIQDAHEAVRPVDVNVLPEDVKSALNPDQYRLYLLIWSRFMASQMASARFHDTNVTLVCENKQTPQTDNTVEKDLYPFSSQWKTKGIRLLFSGFLAVWSSTDDKDEQLPPLKNGQKISVQEIQKEQKFTQPSPRYTEASLVRELEEKGIGRPSTYATIISTIQDRDYVRMEDKHFAPTDLGNVVCSQLRDHFPSLMNIDFTANLENDLDKVAEGELNWVNLLSDFSSDFNTTLKEAAIQMKEIKGGVETDLLCPTCGKPLAIKFGKSGEFLACSAYPDCRFTSNFIRDEKGDIQLQAALQYEVIGECPKCDGNVVLKKAHTGSRFLACANYPECDFAAPYSTGVHCPRCDNGVLVEKSSRRGKLFYACNQYPTCDFALWDYPIASPCPQCKSPVLIRKNTKTNGHHIACPECKYTHVESDEDTENAAIPPKLLLDKETLRALGNKTTKTKKTATKKTSTKAATDSITDSTTSVEEKPKKTKKATSTSTENLNSYVSNDIEDAMDKDKKTATTKTATTKKTTSKTATKTTTAKATKSTTKKAAENNTVKEAVSKRVLVYTDGSCLGNPGKGGYGVILVFGGKRRELSAGFTRTTNNRMEMLGVIEGLKCLKKPCGVDLYTDSQYVAKAIEEKWLANWQKNGWKTAQKKAVKNKDLWQEMAEVLAIHDVKFHWVKGHAGHPENERCDELARTAAESKNHTPDTGFTEEDE